ncbi:MAG: head-tail connector protein [Flavobacteriaceae bacterium]|nr:head-tail connector protein [Flavobacteriaceae bacterium]
MTVEYKQVSKIEKNVISLDEVKLYLRIFGDDDNTMIQMFIDAAYQNAERITGLDLLTTTYECYRPSFYGDLTIRRAPFQSVESIEYLKDGVYTTLDSSKYKVTDTLSYGVIDQIEPPSTDDDVKSVKITFKTGYGDDIGSVPYPIKLSLLQMVSLWYDNRGACECPDSISEILSGYQVIDISHEL